MGQIHEESLLACLCYSDCFLHIAFFVGDISQFAPNSYLSALQSLVMILEGIPLLLESLVIADIILGLTPFMFNIAQLDGN